jgi:hypothetical protein
VRELSKGDIYIAKLYSNARFFCRTSQVITHEIMVDYLELTSYKGRRNAASILIRDNSIPKNVVKIN